MRVFAHIEKPCKGYEAPEFVEHRVCVEYGFAESGMLDDMREVEGEWR